MSLTTNKGIDIIEIGSPSWGQPVNNNSTLIDKAFGSFDTVSGTSGSITLTATQYQNMCLKSGTAAFFANVTFVIPSGVAGQWVVINRSAASSFDLRIKNAANAAFVTIPRGEARLVYSDGTIVVFSETRQVIPNNEGAVVLFARNSAPAGFLKANGAAVSRTTFADLFAVIGTAFGAGNSSTTFNLPDLRGEFIRGWADGRAVDQGRVFGSTQGDAIRNITGVVGVAAITSAYSGAFETGPSNTRLSGDLSGTTTRIAFDASNVVPTAAENRPRNVALLACIKY